MKKKLYLIFWLALVANLSSVWAANTCYYVSPTGSSTATGLTPATATNDLQKILTQFAPGDTVKICTGTYTSPATTAFKIIDKWIQSQFGANVVVRGGYNSNFTKWDPILYPTILKANITNKQEVLYIFRCNSIIEGITIQDGTDELWGGGGMLWDAHDGSFNLVMRNCIFRNNKSTKDGGGFHGSSYSHNWYSACASFYNCLFEGNSSDGWGGGAVAFGPDMRFYNCTFVNNFAKQAGGAVHHNTNGGDLFFSTTIVGNKAKNGCGGVQSHEAYFFNSIIAGNEYMATPSASSWDVASNGMDWGYNIFGYGGFASAISSYYKGDVKAIAPTSIYVSTQELFNMLDADGSYTSSTYFPAHLADNGGYVPTVKLKKVSAVRATDNVEVPIDVHPYYIPTPFVTWGRVPYSTTANRGNVRDTIPRWDARSEKRAGYSCPGAYEYRDSELSNTTFSANWNQGRGSIGIDVQFYKYKKDIRFYHELNIGSMIVEYSVDSGKTFTSLYTINSSKQMDKRNANYRDFSFNPAANGNQFDVRSRTTYTESWIQVKQNTTAITGSDYSNNGTFESRVHWQIPTNLLGKQIILRYHWPNSTTPTNYDQTIINSYNAIGFNKQWTDINAYQYDTVSTTLPVITTAAAWQTDGSLKYTITAPASVPATAQYQVLLNGTDVVKTDAFSTKTQSFNYSTADLSKVKKYGLSTTYSPNPSFAGFPTYNITSKQTIVKAYTLPEKLTVTYNGCDQKNTVAFSVPAITDVANCETANFELCRAEDSTFVTGYKALGAITYSASKPDYTFTDPEVLGVNQNKTFFYKLRRVPMVTAWDWNVHVRKGNVNYNTTHLQINDIMATIDNGKPKINWSYSNSGVFCAGSKITVFRAMNNQAPVEVASFTNINTTSVIDNASLPTCTPLTYSIQIGSAAHGTTTAVASSKIMVPLAAAEQPKLDYLKASKGYYNDRVELEWNLKQGTLSSFLVKRKLYEEGSDKYVTIAEVNTTASKLYKYVDVQTVPSVYYTYQIVSVSSCNGNLTETALLSDIGFRMPTGSVSGRIVYTGDVPVEGANLIIQSADLMRNRALTLGAGTLRINDAKKTLLPPTAFSIQAWLRLKDITSTYTLIDKGTQFQLIKTAAKLQIKVGTVTKDIVGLSLTANTYFHLSIVANSSASFIVYLNGKALAPLTAYTAAVANTSALVIGAAVVGQTETANIDELRIWNKALTAADVANNFDRYIAGKEAGISAYFRLDERIKDFAFDMSSNGTVYNENHATVTGSCPRTETDIPTSAQLSLKGKTDANGNYLVAGIPYYSDGSSYSFTPQLGTHTFNPTQRPLFLGDKSAVQNNVDFTDVSSFKFEGTVVYSGGTYPVEGVSFLIDGKPALDAKGLYIVTDTDGKYSLSVPIGIHTIEASKQGHVFSRGKYTANFQQNYLFPSGYQFEDGTRIKLIGRVVGGKIESEKGLLIGQSKNNIGQATIVLEPLKKDKYDMRSTGRTLVDTVIKHDNGSLTRPTTANNTFSILQKQVTIKTSPLTGEFVAYVYPEDYKVLQTKTSKVDILGGTTSGLYLKSQVNDLYEVSKWTDTITVPAKGTQLAYKKTVEKVDSVLYHAKYIQTLIVDPEFSITELDSLGKTKNYWGDTTFVLNDVINKTSSKVKMVTFANNVPTYTFGAPVFQQTHEYNYIINAFEKYVNADNLTESKVPVKSCSVQIDNTMKVENQNTPEIIELDSLGRGLYTFMGGVPDLSTGLKKFDASLLRENRVFPWSKKFTAYLLGGRSNGSNFTTSGPNKVIHILRDPPGSLSYSYLEKGASVFNNSTSARKQMLDFETSLTHKFGFRGASFIGIGAGIIIEAGSKFDMSVGLHVQQNYSSSTDSTDVVTTTQRFETSADPLWVGSDADVFIGYASNILYGTTSSINIVKKADLTASTVTKVLKNIGDYAIVQGTGIAMGQTFATEFAYTKRDLEQIFIPGWKKIRNKMLLPKGSVVDATKIKYPVYVSLVDPDNEGFGANNNNKEIWGTAASDKIGEGPSYKIYLPAGEKYFSGTDSIVWCNNQIKFWINEMAKNEKQKLEASLIKNQSFTSGSKYEYSVQTETGELTTNDWDVMISGKIGFETGTDISGFGIDVKINTEIGGGYAGSSTTGTQRTKTVGFVLEETGDFDAITVDYKKTQDGGISFNTRGGQTSCPFEDAVYTQYYQPGTILSEATMQIEKPKISVVNSVVNNVPANRNAVFELELKNESEVKGDIYYVLSLDGTTNPNGAILKIDGAVIDENGRSFLVRSDQVLKKTLTITKGPNALDYNNIRLFLASACQSDPTDFTPDIYDEVLVSAHFIPNCSEISMTAPQNNWVLNTTTSDTLAVKLENYDVNYANFGYIALQTKNSSASTWSEEMKFYANTALYNAATGVKSMIDLKQSNIQYKMKLPYADNTFDVRAVAYCIDPVSKVVLAETPTVIASGIKDMVRPTLFGLTQPSDGILNTGDEIQVQFNEDIAEGLITFNNISVTGIKNGTSTIHTVAAHFDGTANSMQTEQTLNLASKSFTFECWLKRTAANKGVIISHGSTKGFEWGFDASNKIYVKNGATVITSSKTYPDITTWNHYAVVYDVEFKKISVYVNGDFSISDQPFGDYTETGLLRVGVSASASNYLAADVHELRAWESKINQGTIAANRAVTYTGIEKGLIGYWMMNEGKGNVAKDKARGRNAALNASWFINPAGKSVNLTGTSSSITLNTAKLPITSSSDYSVELWFKGAAQTNACLFSAGRGDGQEWGNSRNNAALWFDASGLLTFANNGSVMPVSTISYLDNQWHHLALSVNRLSTANIYIDGVLVNNFDARNLSTITASSMYLGMRRYMDKTTYNKYTSDMPFKGQIDEARIWNTNLSENLINQNLNIRLQGTEPGLAAYYPFDKYANGQLTYTLNNQVVASKEVAILAGGAVSTDYAPVVIGSIPEKLGFSFVTNKDKINIKLTEQNSVIERNTINIAVSDIQDKNENILASPIVWSVYVNRNQLKWENETVVLNKAANAEFSYTTRISNIGATAQKFEITNIPDWMTVEPSFGSIKPLSDMEVTFTIDKGLNIGAYDESIYLKSDYSEPLSLRLNVLSEIPDWKVDPAKFTTSMNIIASLKINDLIATDVSDKVAVFMQGVCCGVAEPVFYKELNKYLLYIKVYGNEAMYNSKPTFKVFDASSGKIFSGKADVAITFSENAVFGKPSSPVVISAKDEVYQITQLNQGWSWISFQVASTEFSTVQGALNGMIAKSGDIIKDNAKGLFDSYFEANHLWTGTLTTGGGINNTAMYMIKSSLAQPLSIAGTVLDPSLTKIAIKANKWNYISYLPLRNITVKEALAGYTANADDVLKSQDAFAMYDATLGWIGDLKYMEPGKGYILYRAGTGDVEFAYPKNVASKKGGAITANPRIAAGKYAETMNVVASVKSDFGFDENDWILGYNGAELVSATQMNEVKKQGANLVFANVQSENLAQIRFVLERDGKEIAKANEILAFAGNTVVGNLTSPAVLNFKAISEEINIAAYPNPVTENLTVKVNTLTDENVEITVCDLLGKTLIAPISESPVSHYAETAVNMNALKPGIYVVKIKVDGQMFVRKITKN
jgi:hypothetical protein